MRRSRKYSAVVLASMLFMPSEVRSQDVPQATLVTVGARVRILAPTTTGGRIEGTVVETNETSLLIGVNDRVPLRVPREAIIHLDVSMGQRRQGLKGAIIGAGIGVTAGAPCRWNGCA